MAFSGGTFSRTFDCTTDRDNGVKILASKFDTELDGMATGLSTCILKDGTQTCTAAIPFAEGLTVPDNKTIILGTNSDVTIQYDETTNDSLEIAANVEGAALGIVLKADQGDDAGDEWKLNIADGGTLTLGNDIASAGSYVTHLTITPNSTVSNSTTAVAGNLTIGGALTLGSGAVISEAELETIDGITPGTAAASKAMVLDASLDISGGRNLTISGELDAATLDISGDADIDGTLETDALSIASTAVTATAAELNYSDTGAAVGTVVASKVVTADANKDVASFRNITLTGELDAGSLDVSGDADIDGTLEADAMTLNGTAITATATLDTGISNNNVPKFTSGVADDDFLRVAGTSIEGRSAAEVLSDIGASAVAGSSSIVTTGALNAGSITSGFGAIDNGSSAITTTGVGSFGSLDISGDIDIDGTANLDVVDIDGAVDMASTLQVDGAITSSAGATITTADNTAQLTLKSTDADASVGPRLDLIRDSGSPADGDTLGRMRFMFDNDAAEETEGVRFDVVLDDASDGTEDVKLIEKTMINGSLVERVRYVATETVFNDDSVDVDFRVESNGNANMLFVDGGNNAVGIGSAPNTTFGSLLYAQGTPAANKPIISGYSTGNSNNAGIALFNDGGNRGIWTTGSTMRFTRTYEGNSTADVTIDAGGNVEISSGGFKAIGVYNNTTGSGANVVVDSAGGFARSTSSQRYKNTIADAEHGLTELLALRPVTYKHNANGDKVFGGLIAEEVDAAGLTEFVDYSQDADDNDQPEALYYANMVSLCIKAIQEQQTTITELTARITALEAG